jgi:hypothetical protein
MVEDCVSETRDCRECGIPFSNADRRVVVCSDACRVARKAQRQNRRWARDRAVDPERHRRAIYDRQLRRKYGITIKHYEALLKAQKGVCAICHQVETRRQQGRLTRLAVDHDHKTGRVRGLLCTRCNHALGFVEQNLDVVNRVEAYLAGWLTPSIEQIDDELKKSK